MDYAKRTNESFELAGVTLIGAGPGDRSLITVAGIDALRTADVVVFDALANPALLREVPTEALQIDAGKRAKHHKLTQDQTNALMLEHALKGQHVVRLKGGDPYLFGRGAEEVAYLASHGVPCRVIPGITAGIAAPMMAGIPVTHRDCASSVTFVTGHEDPTKPDSSLDYQALAMLVKKGGTLCVYMGVGRAGLLADTLISHGLSPDTPVGVVQWGTMPSQRSTKTQLDQCEQVIEERGLGAPAILVIGKVAGITDEGLDFFISRPLFGKRVLVTRTRQQASELAESLERLGAEVILAPTIETHPAEDTTEIDGVLADPTKYDDLILTSANAVDAVAASIKRQNLDARSLSHCRVSVVGQATAEYLYNKLCLKADIVPKQANSQSLSQHLISLGGLPGRNILVPHADIAGPHLVKQLHEAGANVRNIVVYHTRMPEALPESVTHAIMSQEVDLITFTSSSTAKNLSTLLGEYSQNVQSINTLSIGPKTTEAIESLGWSVTTESESASIQSMVASAVRVLSGNP